MPLPIFGMVQITLTHDCFVKRKSVNLANKVSEPCPIFDLPILRFLKESPCGGPHHQQRKFCTFWLKAES